MNTITDTAELAMQSTNLFKRVTVLLYGVFAYAIGCMGLFWLILGSGEIAPVGLSEWQASNTLLAVLTNTGLIVLFGVQHSVMARPWFKRQLVKIIPQSAERATFMLMSGIATMSAIYFWQDIPGTIWVVESTFAQVVLWSLYTFGWIYLLLSTFVTNHFELMGLRQVYLYFRNQPYKPLPFTRKFMYRYSRHPMMLGVMIGLWAIPMMTVTHFIMSTLFTIYVVIGIYFEEKDLIKDFGEVYQQYKKEIATFVPGMY